MEIYKIGTDDLDEYDYKDMDNKEDYIWLVYSYESGSYEGHGQAVALHNDGTLHYKDLGHCSCYGPMDKWPEGTITVDDFFKSKNIHWDTWLDSVKTKVGELLGIPTNNDFLFVGGKV